MNTLAHVIVASAALSQPQSPRRNLAIVAGAALPDLSMFAFFAWSRMQGWSGDETWNIHYWIEPWQTMGAVSNSFILLGIGTALAIWRKWPIATALGLAALIHVAFDFPLHADDAHRHFWPITNWRFASPISYWDPAHNGVWGALIESAVVMISAGFLWLRFSRARTRIAIIALLALQCLALTAQLNWGH